MYFCLFSFSFQLLSSWLLGQNLIAAVPKCCQQRSLKVADLNDPLKVNAVQFPDQIGMLAAASSILLVLFQLRFQCVFTGKQFGALWPERTLNDIRIPTLQKKLLVKDTYMAEDFDCSSLLLVSRL